jgi:hypothetical protein
MARLKLAGTPANDRGRIEDPLDTSRDRSRADAG